MLQTPQKISPPEGLISHRNALNVGVGLAQKAQKDANLKHKKRQI